MEEIERASLWANKCRIGFVVGCYLILISATSLTLAYFIFLIATKGILINETATFAVYVIGGTLALTQNKKKI